MTDETDGRAEKAVKGPASYFPAIEKRYGRPVEHWIGIVRGLERQKHGERVAHLKAEHGLGHGHANAIVAHVLTGDRNG